MKRLWMKFPDIRMGSPATTVAKYTKRETNQLVRRPKLSMMLVRRKMQVFSCGWGGTHAYKGVAVVTCTSKTCSEGRNWKALLLISPWHEVDEELMNHESGVYLPGVPV